MAHFSAKSSRATGAHVPLPEIDVDRAFAIAVKLAGGSSISELGRAELLRAENADYVFAREGVIAELKRLDKDLSRDENFHEKMRSMYEGWARRGLVGPACGQTMISTASLPRICALEWVDLIKPIVERRVRKAAAQIKASKELMGMQDGGGLLVVAHDGNYGLEPDAAFNMIHRCLNGSLYSAIDQVVYFTVNMDILLPTHERGRVWLHGYRPGAQDKIPLDLIQRLKKMWMGVEGLATGEPYRALDDVDISALGSLRFERSARR